MDHRARDKVSSLVTINELGWHQVDGTVTPPITPPNSPQGELWVNELGDVSMALTFPTELTSWAELSARIELSSRGANVSGHTFKVRNVPILPNSATHNIALQSPHPQSLHHRAGSWDSRPYSSVVLLVYSQGSPMSNCHTPSPQSSLYGSMQNLHIAKEPDDDANEPEIAPFPFWLEDLPDPVYPRIGNMRGLKEPLPFYPPHGQMYFVVIRGYKIGIFLEQW